MSSVRRLISCIIFSILVTSFLSASPSPPDDTAPEITDRVARLSVVEGEAQIKRAGSDGWENAVVNLPVVAGDEIITAAFAKVEIQFDTKRYVRIYERSSVKISTLRDEGIAISLPEGSIIASLSTFDPAREFFEIDAPGSTIAVERSGTFRVDGGKSVDDSIRVTATKGGQARLYSASSGSTLNDGRSSKLYISGPLAGEFDSSDAAQFADEFDSWSTERDATITEKLNDAYYDKYYDKEIYGAEDLSGYGTWVYNRSYGYIWQPSQTSTGAYADWSPYRYGQWRWLDPYGWTWVNDEPWGWATYHHGRWIYDAGSWYWSPYSAFRNTRSWWYPALVVIQVLNNSVCWYPLPYDYAYNDYNRHHRRQRDSHGHHGGTTAGQMTPSPTPAPGPVFPNPSTNARTRRTMPHSFPDTSVTSIPLEDFGSRSNSSRRVGTATASRVLSEASDTPPILPTIELVRPKVNREIRPTNRIVMTRPDETGRTGAMSRDSSEPLGTTLRSTRTLGGRQPIITNPVVTASPDVRMTRDARSTGAVTRAGRSNPVSTPDANAASPALPPGTGRDTGVQPQRERRHELRTPNVIRPSGSTQRERPSPPQKPRYEPSPPPETRSQPKSEPKSEPRNEPRPAPKTEPTKVEPPAEKRGKG